MLNKYNDDNHHIIQLDIEKHKSMKFLPLMCRLSIKDIKINHSSSSSSSRKLKVTRTSSSSDEYEPPSPKVGCMGQVKRNNRVIGFPITSSSVHVNEQAVVAETRHHKYSKLKRLFSGKGTLLVRHPTATASASAVVVGRSGSNSRRSSRRDPIICSSISTVNNNNDSRRFIRLKNDYRSCSVKNDDDRHHFRECTVDIGEIDPPLPVVKTTTADHHHEVNLWKRRFNDGVALKNLQIERVVH